jgi:hypothetical protein
MTTSAQSLSGLAEELRGALRRFKIIANAKEKEAVGMGA